MNLTKDGTGSFSSTLQSSSIENEVLAAIHEGNTDKLDIKIKITSIRFEDGETYRSS